MKLVVDASVIAKWLFAEVDSDKARALYADSRKHDLKLIAPQLLPAEIASILFVRVIRGLLQAEEASALYSRFELVCPALHEIPSLIPAAVQLALHHHHSVYDSLYVALAVREGCGMVTADEELHETFSPALPLIRRLRDWP